MRNKYFVLFLFLGCFSLLHSAITTSVNTTPTGCGLNNGTAKATSSGAAAYTYLWSTGATSDTISNLAVGVYSLTVKDAANPSDSIVSGFSITANAVNDLNITAFQNDTTCIGKQAKFLAQGNSAGGSYTWSGSCLSGYVTTPLLTTSPGATCSYFVRWQNGTCDLRDTVKIVAYQVKAFLNSVKEPDCYSPSGQIKCSASGFQFDFTFLKNGNVFVSGQGTELNTNVKAGNYSFVVHELATGCFDTISNIIIYDTASYPYVQNIMISDEKCYNDKLGSIVVNLTGGSGTYTYSWSNNAANNTNSNTNLAAGSYTLSFTDGVCPNIDTTIKVGGPTAPLTAVLKGYDDYCSQSIGAAKATISGGSKPYVISWNNGATTDSISGLLGNMTYTLNVTDSNNCVFSDTVRINNNIGPVVSALPIDTICDGASNGVITLQSNSLASFSYQWSHNPALNSAIATGLSAGNYSVTVTANGACTAVYNFTIYSYDATQISLGNDQSIYKGQSATINVSSPYSITKIVWTPTVAQPDIHTAVFSPLVTTTYNAEITYGKNCKVTDQITINVIEEDAVVDIPSIFTPNGDNINDDFYVKSKAVKEFRVLIFDRWGNKLFESDDINFRWDGKNKFGKDEALNTGVYQYLIEYIAYNNAERVKKEGNINLIK